MALRSSVFPLALLLSIGCDSGTRTETTAAAPAPAASVAGTYRVSGTTVERGSSASRRIEGTIVLTQEGDAYRASFQLSTLYPGPDGDHQAVVIGKGEGSVAGSELTGSAHTQVVVAAIPGVDTDFAFAPRAVTTRIESTSRATLAADGTLVIEIENVPAAGESYRPTQTRLSGERVALAAVGASPTEAE